MQSSLALSISPPPSFSLQYPRREANRIFELRKLGVIRPSNLHFIVLLFVEMCYPCYDTEINIKQPDVCLLASQHFFSSRSHFCCCFYEFGRKSQNSFKKQVLSCFSLFLVHILLSTFAVLCFLSSLLAAWSFSQKR